MTTDIKFNPSLSATVATQGTAANEQPNVQQEKQVAPLLGGENVKVTSGAMTDLEKLVAQLKNEQSNTRANLAQMRSAAIMSALEIANVRLTAEQAAAVETITEEQTQIDELGTKLSELYSTYGISSGDSSSAVMDMLIQSLEKAVERAVQEGKDHNETVAKAKERLESDQAKLDQLENADVKDEVAIAAAKEAVADAQGAYDEATAVAAGDAKAIADAQSALAKANEDAGTMKTLEAGIAEAASGIDAATATIGNEKMREIAAALSNVTEGDAESFDERISNAEVKKKAAKEEAFDIGNIISKALDKIEDAIMRTIEENQTVQA